MEELRRKRREYLQECNIPKPEWTDVEKKISSEISKTESKCLSQLKEHFIRHGNFTGSEYLLKCIVTTKHTTGNMYEIKQSLIERYPNMEVSTFKYSKDPNTTAHDTYAITIKPEHFM
jgi:hypothetical protein